jgi:hypothetical protein
MKIENELFAFTDEEKEVEYILRGEGVWEQYISRAEQGQPFVSVYRPLKLKEQWLIQFFNGCSDPSENGWSITRVPQKYVQHPAIILMMLGVEKARKLGGKVSRQFVNRGDLSGN